MRTALITGGAGFIGSHLGKALLDKGWKVYVVDNLSTGSEANLPEGVEFIRLDLSDNDFVSLLPSVPIDVVFHLAAQSSGEISFDDPAYDLKTNTVSTVLLLQWCAQRGIKRFIYTSSMSIYGDQRHDRSVGENAPINPKSFYGIGKLASEKYMALYALQGINSTAYRLFNVYGPGQNMKNLRQGMVSIFLAYLHAGREILVKGPLPRFRDFIYIQDVIDCFMHTLDSPVTYGKSYNVGTGVKTTVGQLLQEMIRIYGNDDVRITVGEGTPGDQFGVYADITKIQNETGWSPQVQLSVGLRKMIGWIKSL